MSGHSKWSSIKHKKAATDAKRGQLFTKLARDITVAARAGADPEMNSALRLAIQKARDSNMPGANVERALLRATGGGDGASLEEIVYEGYAPGGTAVLIQTVTDNRNRTVADIRVTLNRGGGTLAENGAVSWMFELRGVITIDAAGADADEIQLTAIEAGAEDVSADEQLVEVLTSPGDLEAVREALTEAGFTIASAENRADVEDHGRARREERRPDPATARSTGRARRRSRAFYSNADFSDEVLAAASLGE